MATRKRERNRARRRRQARGSVLARVKTGELDGMSRSERRVFAQEKPQYQPERLARVRTQSELRAVRSTLRELTTRVSAYVAQRMPVEVVEEALRTGVWPEAWESDRVHTFEVGDGETVEWQLRGPLTSGQVAALVERYDQLLADAPKRDGEPNGPDLDTCG